MYHCHFRFYLAGNPCKAFEIIQEMPPLEHFTHTFSIGTAFSKESAAGADAIFVNLQEMNVTQAMQTLSHGRIDKESLILLADREQIPLLANYFSEITDIWVLPMTDEEIRFRFLRWQQTCKMQKDFWQTDHYLEATINNIPNLIWYKNKDGIHEKVNRSFCQTVNKTKEQVEGRDHYYIWDVTPEECGQDCMESDLEVIQKKKTCVSEENVQSGNEFKLLTTYKSPLYDLDGSVMGTVGVGIDITQERKYEQEIIQKNHALETIFTSMDCGILCHTADGQQILNVNKAALRILGYESQEELMADGFHMIAPSVMKEDQPKLNECIKSLKKEGDTVNIEYRVQHRDGKILHVMGNIKLLKENGVPFYQRFLLDYTAQKMQEQKNQQRQMELIQALSIDYNLVFYFNLDTGDGTALRVSNDSLHILNTDFSEKISLTESMNHYIETLVYEEDQELLRQACSPEHLKKELQEKPLYYINFRILDDNEIQYYEMKVVRTETWEETHSIVLGLCNVNEKTRNEMEQKRRLREALLEANRASRAKSIFLSNMSHDIRTPMNAIVGFTALAISHIDCREQVQEYLKKIATSSDHLLNLINDVLDMSRIESGKIQTEETSCRLSELLCDLTNIVQADVQAKQLDFHIDCADIVNDEIYCDKLRLNQVLLNVVSNSIKYTNAGGSISLKVSEKPGAPIGHARYRFCIQDNGIGMDKEFISHIFEPFERENNTTTSKIQGTGLGMAITKNIIEIMNGSIDVKSELGHGTQVTILLTFRLSSLKETAPEKPETLPEKPETAPEKPPVSNTAEKDGGNGTAAPAEIQTGHILLAEDNELNQEIATAILEDAGFSVEVAENGQVAFDMLKNSLPGHYRLILMDIQMPVMNGYDATIKIRNLGNRELASIPIFAMTANAFEEDRQKALKCGMNGHIAKPIDVGQLFQVLGEIL